MIIRHRHKIGLLLDQVMVSGTAILSQSLVAYGLGLKQYGLYSVILLVQLFLLSIQQAGISGLFQTRYPAMDILNGKIYYTGVWTQQCIWIAGLLLLALLIFPVCNFGYTPTQAALILLNITGFLLQDFFRRILITKNDLGTLLLINVLNNGVQLVALGLLYLYHTISLNNVLLVCGLTFVPSVLWGVYRTAPRLSLKAALTSLHQNKREGRWMVAAAILQWFAGNFYIIAAGWWLGAAALGILRLAQYFFGLFNLLFQAAENYILPRAGQQLEAPQNMIAYLKKVQYKGTAGMLVLLIFLLITIRIIHWYRPFDEAGTFFTVLYGMCGIYLLVFIGYPVRIALRLLGQANVFFQGYVLTAIFGLSTANLLIQTWGLKGVIAGWLCSQLLIIAYWLRVLHKKYAIL